MTASPSLKTLRALAFGKHGVSEKTSCSNAAFHAGGKNFLFLGMQEGRLLVRLKLVDRLAQAQELAAKDPDSYAAGKGGWVTARLKPNARLATKRWQDWIDDSYRALVPKKAQG